MRRVGVVHSLSKIRDSQYHLRAHKKIRSPKIQNTLLLSTYQTKGKANIMAPSANFSTDEKEATPIPEEFKSLDKYWRASNYLSVGQIYLYGKNPLLRRPLDLSDIKPRLLGHWGTVPGQNFIYCHLNRLIKKEGVSMLYISGPGHGGNAQVAQSYLEGTYSEIYPNITQDEVSKQRNSFFSLYRNKHLIKCLALL